ncbi:MAG: oxygenase MpaB family protein, partial [Acidimicrobiales bacterium]
MYRFDDDLGPDSLLWRYAGDTRISFLGGTIGLLQLMHPGIGAGVMDHSDFFNDPFDRVFRSLPPILGAVYDGPEAMETGRWIRDQHRAIKGADAQGRSYHALDPATFWWAHATFQFMAEQVVDRFDDRRLTRSEREQMYREGITWYRRYGVSDRPVPGSRAAFQTEWDRVCEHDLEMNDAVAFVLQMLDKPLRLALPRPLGVLNPVLRRGPVARAVAVPARISAIGGLPTIVRERFDIPWTRADQRQLDALELAVRKAWRFVPFSVRWQPRAQDGWKRVRDERGGRAWRA